ncbi:calcium:cation antiporter [Flindersiella endophytica]
MGLAAVLVAGSVLTGAGAGAVLPFAVSAAAVAVLAALVGRAVDHLADLVNAGAVGVLQSALGNLPELFICLFALRSGLTDVVTSAVIGSILANLLLVLGLSMLAGGLRHKVLTFSASRARLIMGLLLLAVAAMLVPSLVSFVHTPAAGHEVGLSRVTAIVLLAVFAFSIPASLRAAGGPEQTRAPATEKSTEHANHKPWPLWLTIGMLAVTGVLAAYVSDRFVEALQPAMDAIGISQAFAGLVVVAIAGNAVENTVGVKLAWQNRPETALSVILNSPLQIALVLVPALVLLAPLVGSTPFVMVFSPLLVTTVAAGTLAVAYLIQDGESDAVEGAAMVGLYVLIAAAFWWG